jgi:lysophospholipase L1-like esterase
MKINIKKSILINLTISLFTLFGSYFLIEYVAKKILPHDTSQTKALTKILNNTKKSYNGYGYSLIDPLLGWAYDKETAKHKDHQFHGDYVVFGKINNTNKRIMILGGSTSDSTMFTHSWAEELFNLRKEKNLTIYNGGVAGYSSTQELFKLIRDIGTIKPDLVIIYDGFNEATSHIEGYPYSNHHLTYLLAQVIKKQNNLFFTNAVNLFNYKKYNRYNITGINLGPKYDKRKSMYKTKILQMKAIADVEGVKLIHILQPYLSPTFQNVSKEHTQILNERNFFIKYVDRLYEDFVNIPVQLEVSHDFTRIFKNSDGIFKDTCHLTKKGDILLAKKTNQLINETFVF